MHGMMCFVYFRKPCEIRKGSEKTDLYKISDETKYQLGSTAGEAVRLESCCWFFIAQVGVELEKVATSLQKKSMKSPKCSNPIEFVGLFFLFIGFVGYPLLFEIS